MRRIKQVGFFEGNRQIKRKTAKEIKEPPRKRRFFFLLRGDNARIPGWMQCHYRLQFDDNGFPGMYVFANCEAFIRTVPLMIYDEHCPEDMDSDLEDHVADEWRYACMSRPIRPVIPPKPVHLLIDPLEKRKTFLKSDRIWMR